MCGISGVVFSDRSREVSVPELAAMTDIMVHRGPDDSGAYRAPGVALGSRRLSILDLSPRGHMPMSTPDGRYRIAYNGEVYNYRELRAQLESRGRRFVSNTDTEVVLALYAEEGPESLGRLNGMFAFAVWDTWERTLFIARDRLGVKPLYYAVQDGAMFFASEEKALFAAGVTPQFDHETWEELLCFRYVAGERTPFAGVRRLLPGHYLLWKNGDITVRRWWNLAERARARRGEQPAEVATWFRETFDSSVDLRRISDVPVGVLLSGGLDSSSVAASLATQTDSKVASFTVRFSDPSYDEGPLARLVAERWNLEHHELEVTPDKLLDLLRTAAWLNDEPLVHGNDLHLLAISRYAKRHVTVLLSGEGGDETLGGYVRYRPLRHPHLLAAARPLLPMLSAPLGGRMRKLSRFMQLGAMDRFVLYNASDLLPNALAALGMESRADFPFREGVLSEAQELYPGDYMRQAMYSDQHTFLSSILDRNDRMTMGASIECRVPFLDYRLVETLAAMPSSVLLKGREGKGLLRQALGARLPPAILKHRKWGFGVPWSAYFRQHPELRELVRALPTTQPLLDGPFDRGKLFNAVEDFLRGGQRFEGLIRQLVMIVIWHEVFFSSAIWKSQVSQNLPFLEESVPAFF